jgi:hypothetical protein
MIGEQTFVQNQGTVSMNLQFALVVAGSGRQTQLDP